MMVMLYIHGPVFAEMMASWLVTLICMHMCVFESGLGGILCTRDLLQVSSSYCSLSCLANV